MKKILTLAVLVVTFAFVALTSVNAQTSTPTTTPTPTTMPAGAPSTGYGTM